MPSMQETRNSGLGAHRIQKSSVAAFASAIYLVQRSLVQGGMEQITAKSGWPCAPSDNADRRLRKGSVPLGLVSFVHEYYNPFGQ